MDSIILNIIMIVFPVLVYFIYNCYRELRNDKYNFLVFDISLVSSLYLCFKYGGFYSLLFSNIPIMIGYFNRRINLVMILSFFCTIYNYLEFGVNIYFLVIKFFVYLIIYFLGNKLKISYGKYIMVSLVIVGFCCSFEYFSIIRDGNFINFGLLILFMFLFYIICFGLMNLFSLCNNITSLYVSNYELEQDKKMRSSLFKITHEVKNPMAVCKGYLEMFDINDKEQSLKFISIIKSEIDRSLGIMSDFMEFSKIKREKEIMDINMLLEDIEDEFQIFIGNKKINFHCKYIDDEIFVLGDYNRLKQVFINLIKNSIEAIGENDGDINIITHILKGYYYIEISDNGGGIEKDDLSKIKEMFFTTKQSGSGLGVSLSDEIIRGHDGKMTYYSKVGIGTRVIVKLPIIVL